LLAGNDVDAKYKAAFGYFNKSKYIKSAKLFENLLLAVQGTAQEDTVQYYMALSNYRYGDYQTAEQGFEKFIEVFPRSPFTEEAKYLRIKCLYDATYRYELDQTPTKKAMAIINQFMNENPGSEYYPICKTMLGELQERLDKKNYEAARLYYNMEDYKAAHYALKNVLKENADNAYREDVLYYTALASYKYAANSIPSKQKERFMSFIDDYYNYIGEYSNTNERKALDNLYERAQKYTKKN
jgi:outer membrane protein assembly factor BamD